MHNKVRLAKHLAERTQAAHLARKNVVDDATGLQVVVILIERNLEVLEFIENAIDCICAGMGHEGSRDA